MIPKETLGLAAEFAVASELCRRGLYAQLTLGNRKRTDLLVHDDKTNNFLRIEVKAKQGHDWPNCKGIYGENVMLVFVDYMNKKERERPDFFVLTVDDWKELVTERTNKLKERFPGAYVNDRNVAVVPAQRKKNGKSYEGTGVNVALIGKYLEKWDKIKRQSAAVGPFITSMPKEVGRRSGHRYEGSQAQKWDRILMEGGTWQEMAEKAGITPSRLRQHAKHRTNVMKKYTLVEEAGQRFKVVPIQPTPAPAAVDRPHTEARYGFKRRPAAG